MDRTRRSFLKFASIFSFGSLFSFGKNKKERPFSGKILIATCTFCKEKIYNKREFEPGPGAVSVRAGNYTEDVWYHLKNGNHVKCHPYTLKFRYSDSSARPLDKKFERVSFEEYLKLKKNS